MAGPSDREPAAAAVDTGPGVNTDQIDGEIQPAAPCAETGGDGRYPDAAAHGVPSACAAPADAGPGSDGSHNGHKVNGHTPGRSPAARGSERVRQRGGDDAGTIYAALDLGTNNCRLLVARPTSQGFRVIDAFSRIIRLGEGIGRSGELSEDAIVRTIDALKICTQKMVYQGVRRSRVIATEACRIARNADEFVERVRSETGLRLEIVSRETEARLAVSGCASLIDPRCEGALVFDIGGGSSEIAWLNLKPGERCCPLKAQERIGAWTSLQVGVVTLAEKFGGVDVSRAMFEAMVEDVMQRLAAFEKEHSISEKVCGRNVHMLGTSGTVTTIAGVHLALPRYDRSRVDGCWLSAEQVHEVTGRLVDMTYSERVANPCIGSERADLVLAGCAILEGIRRQWPCARLRVADRGLREGILSTLMAEDGVLTPAQPKRRRRRGYFARPRPANDG